MSHSIELNLDKCAGCTACVKVCPTGALVLLTEDEFKARQAAENEKKARLMMEKQLAR